MRRLPGVPLLDHLLHQPHLVGQGGTHLLAAEDHPLGPARPHQLGEALGTAGAGQEPHRGLRQPQLGLLLGDADVAGQRHFQSAPHGIAIDGGDADPVEAGQRLEGAAEGLGHVAGVLDVAVGEHLEIGASAEELVTGTADHQGHHVGAAVQLHHHLQEGLQAGEGPGVGRRVVEGDIGHVTLVFEPDPCHCIVLVIETCP